MRRRPSQARTRRHLRSRPRSLQPSLQTAEASWGSAPTGSVAEANQGLGGGRPLGIALPEEEGEWRAVTRSALPLRQARRLVHESLWRPETKAIYCSRTD